MKDTEAEMVVDTGVEVLVVMDMDVVDTEVTALMVVNTWVKVVHKHLSTMYMNLYTKNLSTRDTSTHSLLPNTIDLDTHL